MDQNVLILSLVIRKSLSFTFHFESHPHHRPLLGEHHLTSYTNISCLLLFSTRVQPTLILEKILKCNGGESFGGCVQLLVSKKRRRTLSFLELMTCYSYSEGTNLGPYPCEPVNSKHFRFYLSSRFPST